MRDDLPHPTEPTTITRSLGFTARLMPLSVIAPSLSHWKLPSTISIPALRKIKKCFLKLNMGEKGVERRKIELEKTGFGFARDFWKP